MRNSLRIPRWLYLKRLEKRSLSNKDKTAKGSYKNNNPVPVAIGVCSVPDSPNSGNTSNGCDSPVRGSNEMIRVKLYNDLPDEKFLGKGYELHVSSNGVLCIRKGGRYVKVYNAGEWRTAEEDSN